MRQARNAPESTSAARTEAAAVENRLTSVGRGLAPAGQRGQRQRQARPGHRATPLPATRCSQSTLTTSSVSRPRRGCGPRAAEERGRAARPAPRADAASTGPGLAGSSQAADRTPTAVTAAMHDLLGGQRAPRGGLQQGARPGAAQVERRQRHPHHPGRRRDCQRPGARARTIRRQARSSLSSPEGSSSVANQTRPTASSSPAYAGHRDRLSATGTPSLGRVDGRAPTLSLGRADGEAERARRSGARRPTPPARRPTRLPVADVLVERDEQVGVAGAR